MIVIGTMVAVQMGERSMAVCVANALQSVSRPWEGLAYKLGDCGGKQGQTEGPYQTCW